MSRAAALGAAVCAAILGSGALSSTAARSQTSVPAAPSTTLVEPRACAGCHAEVTREWQESLHAQSFRDPIFLAEYRPHPVEDCVACHAPLATNLVAPGEVDTREGVACVACHVDAAGHILGTTWGRPTGSVPGRTTARGDDAPHPVQRSAELGSAAACARCHEFGFPPPRDRSMGYDPTVLQQATFTEWRGSRAGRQGLACVSCHMPRRADGHVDHRMPGASAELLARSVRVDVRATREHDGVAVRVTLRTRDVGHALPTGDIFRRLIVRAELGAESMSSELRRHFGTSHVGDALVTTEIDDTRLMPGRPRVVTLHLPPVPDVHAVRWSVSHARLDLAVARARGLPLGSVQTVFRSGEAPVR
ncbi:MAG: multiheme c-type cytochrome [Polyangiales bacterium]|nr:hypothetical protein [Sandaracinaceae bacterium]